RQSGLQRYFTTESPCAGSRPEEVIPALCLRGPFWCLVWTAAVPLQIDKAASIAMRQQRTEPAAIAAEIAHLRSLALDALRRRRCFLPLSRLPSRAGHQRMT